MEHIVKALTRMVANSCNWRVLWFAQGMQATLEKNKKLGKSGWEQMSDDQILTRLKQEVKELGKAKTHDKKIKEAFDVANFAMFFAMRYVDGEGVVAE